MTTHSSTPQRLITTRGNILENLTVRQKLNILIIAMTLGMVSIFVISLSSASIFRLHISDLYEGKLIPITKITNAETQLAETQVLIEELQNKELTEDQKSAYFASVENSSESVASILEEYETKWMTTNNSEFTRILRDKNKLDLQEEEVATFQKLKTAFETFRANEASFQNEVTAGIYNNELANNTKSAINETKKQLHNLVELNDQFAKLTNDAAIASYQDNNLSLIVALFLAVTIGLILSYTVANSISSRLYTVENIALAYQDGYLDRRHVATIQGNDEIARLARTFNALFNQIQETLIGLEERVHERTASLTAATEESERRAKQFEAITMVGSAISSIRSLDELLPKITELISQQFGYYHAGIFLNDTKNENAVLSAANSEGGKRMLQRGHQLRVGEQGIVGYTTGTGKPRIALDVGEDAVYFNNPDMPNTRSEMALPLKIGNAVVGALDVQSTEESAFGEEDITALSLLADQVSLAIENARLFDQARRSLAESEALYRQYLRQAWSRLPKEQNLAGYRYNVRGTVPIDNKTRQGTAGNQEVEDESQEPRISVPIAIRGETIGTLSVKIPDISSLNDDQMDLVNAVAERVALSAENARLFEETTRRAERERLVSDITVKIRSTNDPDSMINIALEELKNALGATKVQLVPHAVQRTMNATQQPDIPDSDTENTLDSKEER